MRILICRRDTSGTVLYWVRSDRWTPTRTLASRVAPDDCWETGGHLCWFEDAT